MHFSERPFNYCTPCSARVSPMRNYVALHRNKERRAPCFARLSARPEEYSQFDEARNTDFSVKNRNLRCATFTCARARADVYFLSNMRHYPLSIIANTFRDISSLGVPFNPHHQSTMYRGFKRRTARRAIKLLDELQNVSSALTICPRHIEKWVKCTWPTTIVSFA